MGMVRGSRDGMPCHPFFVIRSYNASFMNDDDECIIGYQAFLDEIKKRNSYFGKKLTDRQLKIIQTKVLEGQQRYYISSFAKAKDCLPMWRTYGNEGNGIAVGLDSEILASNGFPAYSCIYDSNTIDRIVKGLCDWSDSVTNLTDDDILSFNKSIYLLSFLAKNHHFNYEQECRICSYFEVFTKNNTASFNNGTKSYDIQFECRNGRINSFIEIEMPISVLKEIWIGPTNCYDSSLASLNMWLNSLRLNDKVAIHKSSVPLK